MAAYLWRGEGCRDDACRREGGGCARVRVGAARCSPAVQGEAGARRSQRKASTRAGLQRGDCLHEEQEGAETRPGDGPYAYTSVALRLANTRIDANPRSDVPWHASYLMNVSKTQAKHERRAASEAEWRREEGVVRVVLKTPQHNLRDGPVRGTHLMRRARKERRDYSTRNASTPQPVCTIPYQSAPFAAASAFRRAQINACGMRERAELEEIMTDCQRVRREN
ncbi:hypothetical protein FB451DRAFT_1303862 [Mycena latifolia]|nr:hypothetical protein FB451DRAFT_1303862 [Mycena latifolia]